MFKHMSLFGVRGVCVGGVGVGERINRGSMLSWGAKQSASRRGSGELGLLGS